MRKEQRLLRQRLFGSDPIGCCAICGKEFPVQLIVAAHVKRRAECGDGERRDFHNVVAMCRMGCDELFERGIIAVDQGQVVVREAFPFTSIVKRYVASLRGRRCGAYSPDSEAFFDWHFRQHQPVDEPA